MFGSRIRSWMENHIGRPRKRNNKNKQGNGNIESSKKESIHLHSAIASITSPTSAAASIGHSNGNHCCDNGYVASPVRRREVSPIQNHSRYGWQSPDSEGITSPKSDNFLYAPKQHYHHNQHQRHPSNNSHLRQQSTPRYEFDPKPEQSTILSEPKGAAVGVGVAPVNSAQSQLKPENSSSSFSSLSWSTGSKEPSSVSIEKQQNGNRTELIVPKITYQTANEIGPNHAAPLDEDADVVHYEEIQTTTILRNHDNLNRNFIYHERPKSEQLTTFNPLPRRNDFTPQRRSIDDSSSSVRYGKLLPSRIQCRGSNESITVGSAECLRLQKPSSYVGAPYLSQPYRPRNGCAPTAVKTVNNIKGGALIPLHSLSSPESAYSTGYSTDGTSPGACYNQAPEYYINMRTGTHYFPKSVNSLAIESQRCKFGLNKIEEMSPIEPMPKTSFATATCSKTSTPSILHKSGQSLDVRTTTAVLPTLTGYESSSPRQRCRIRTNPWVSTATHDSAAQLGMNFQQLSNTSTTSSTVCSSRSSASVVSAQADNGSSHQYLNESSNQQQQQQQQQRKYFSKNSFKNPADISKYSKQSSNGKAMYDSCSSLETEDTSKQHRAMSLTEVDSSECPRASTSNNSLMLAKCLGKRELSSGVVVMPTYTSSAAMQLQQQQQQQPVAYLDASEEDATLNEMMGKFDESYVYEKETDILSDSDATNCPSELDTGDAGDDAGDECDTDELLDIDFIDTTSIQEISEKREQRQGQAKAFARKSFNGTKTELADNGKHKRSGSSVRRRKRLVKTRKKSTSENKENTNNIASPMRKSRETRSVGGTPISLRRNAKTLKESRNYKMSSLSERASSLVFPHDEGRRYLTVAESNKALLKADLEADFKYRQLIQEAESILVSLKSSAQSLPRETPICSPRRVNPLINKRVEMLKINEIKQPSPPLPPPQLPSRSSDMEQDFSAVLNKRIERLKFESTSAPNSPRSGAPRFSPRKTHITNFINQIDGQRRASLTPIENHLTNYAIQAQNQSPSKVMKTPPMKRSILKANKIDDQGCVMHPYMHFDSETEIDNSNVNRIQSSAVNSLHKMDDMTNHNIIITKDLMQKNVYDDYTNHNLNAFESNMNRIDMRAGMGRHYCPQSEPLKRKVYKCSNNFDRIKCNFDFQGDSNKSPSWLGHQNAGNLRTQTPKNSTQDLNLNSPLLVNRKQLLLDTLSELKQNLENQSVQLNELNIE